MNDQIIEVPKEYIDKIFYKLMELEALSSDFKVKDELGLLVEFMENTILNHEGCNLLDLIYDKMIEVKGSDEELNAKLYILYQDLKNGKISNDKALDIFTTYVHLEGMI